jgi:ribosomal protein S18 acetylase RimI-like enzyme
MQQKPLTTALQTENGLRIVDITGAHYGDIPDDYFSHSSCKSCLFWENGNASEPQTTEEREAEKRRWFNSINLVFGPSGKIAYQDGVVVGWAQYAPASCFPKVSTYYAYPSEDAYLITCLAVKPEYRHRGIGEFLLKAVIEDLRARGLKAVETFARKGSPSNPSGPVELYLKAGFKTKTEDEFLPLLRLELNKGSIENMSAQSFSRI